LGDREKAYVEEAFASNWIAPVGPNVDAFEHELAALVGVRSAAAVSSGTAAIHLALLVLGVRRDDVVFCSTFTFAASANPIVYLGARPVFIDSEAESWNMCPTALERAFELAELQGALPRAVIVVNLYGQSANMHALKGICDSYDVPIIEDAAESLGARYEGKPSGTFGKLGIYSFNGNKIITTSGGGMLVSNDEELIKKARFLSTQAREPVLHYEHTEIGYNYRMSNILAGVGRGQLHVLTERVKARRSVFEKYQRALSGIESITWMPEPSWSYSTRWLTTFTLDSSLSPLTSSELIAALGEESIEARPLWKPMHRQPIYKEAKYVTAVQERSISDKLFESGVCLPSGSNMEATQVDRVIAVLRQLLQSGFCNK
jgi:dTDP-4-amino-4,6-dideoxygalactose transaminase